MPTFTEGFKDPQNQNSNNNYQLNQDAAQNTQNIVSRQTAAQNIVSQQTAAQNAANIYGQQGYYDNLKPAGAIAPGSTDRNIIVKVQDSNKNKALYRYENMNEQLEKGQVYIRSSEIETGNISVITAEEILIAGQGNDGITNFVQPPSVGGGVGQTGPITDPDANNFKAYADLGTSYKFSARPVSFPAGNVKPSSAIKVDYNTSGTDSILTHTENGGFKAPASGLYDVNVTLKLDSFRIFQKAAQNWSQGSKSGGWAKNRIRLYIIKNDQQIIASKDHNGVVNFNLNNNIFSLQSTLTENISIASGKNEFLISLSKNDIQLSQGDNISIYLAFIENYDYDESVSDKKPRSMYRTYKVNTSEFGIGLSNILLGGLLSAIQVIQSTVSGFDENTKFTDGADFTIKGNSTTNYLNITYKG